MFLIMRKLSLHAILKSGEMPELRKTQFCHHDRVAHVFSAVILKGYISSNINYALN